MHHILFPDRRLITGDSQDTPVERPEWARASQLSQALLKPIDTLEVIQYH